MERRYGPIRASRNTIWTLHNNYTVDRYEESKFNTHLSGYGLGWNLRDYDGNLFVGHTGGYDGMLSAVSLIPDKGIGVVVLTNGMKSPFMAATYYLLDELLGRPEQDWSKMLLEGQKQRTKNDTRISDRIGRHQEGTKPSLDIEDYAELIIQKFTVTSKLAPEIRSCVWNLNVQRHSPQH